MLNIVRAMLTWGNLGMSETWLDLRCTNNLLSWEGMSLYRHDRINTGGGGGVGCFVSQRFAQYSLKLENLCLSTPDIEILVLKVVKPNNRRMLICTY